MYLKQFSMIYVHQLLGVSVFANLSIMWTLNLVLDMCAEEYEKLDLAKGRIKTVHAIIGLCQILVYVSTFSRMMLGGHCQLDVTIPYAMSINM